MNARAGVLINVASGRGNGKGTALLRQLRGAAGIDVQVLSDFSALLPALQHFAKNQITDLFISSGDGTLQAVMTHIAESGAWSAMPRLCILPHGTTNLSADDIGFSAKNIGRQAEFIKTVPPATIELRHSLHVLNPKTGGPRHGFTIGAGAAANATRHAQNAFNNKGVRGAYATFATIVSGFGKAALKPATPGQKARIDCPCVMRFETSGKILADGLQVFFIATTLNRLFFNARPFWGKQSGPIRASSFAYPVANVWRWGLPMMYGSENRLPPPGAASFSGTEFSITCAEPYVMDGEFFEGQENQPLRVILGPAFTFITGPARP